MNGLDVGKGSHGTERRPKVRNIMLVSYFALEEYKVMKIYIYVPLKKNVYI